jgi:hypothetical protein
MHNYHHKLIAFLITTAFANKQHCLGARFQRGEALSFLKRNQQAFICVNAFVNIITPLAIWET